MKLDQKKIPLFIARGNKGYFRAIDETKIRYRPMKLWQLKG